MTRFQRPVVGAVRSGAGRRGAPWATGAAVRPVRLVRAFWVFVALALLALPLFAHGCHGDDVDHEPLFIPLRLNGNDR